MQFKKKNNMLHTSKPPTYFDDCVTMALSVVSYFDNCGMSRD